MTKPKDLFESARQEVVKRSGYRGDYKRVAPKREEMVSAIDEYLFGDMQGLLKVSDERGQGGVASVETPEVSREMPQWTGAHDYLWAQRNLLYAGDPSALNFFRFCIGEIAKYQMVPDPDLPGGFFDYLPEKYFKRASHSVDVSARSKVRKRRRPGNDRNL